MAPHTALCWTGGGGRAARGLQEGRSNTRGQCCGTDVGLTSSASVVPRLVLLKIGKGYERGEDERGHPDVTWKMCFCRCCCLLFIYLFISFFPSTSDSLGYRLKFSGKIAIQSYSVVFVMVHVIFFTSTQQSGALRRKQHYTVKQDVPGSDNKDGRHSHIKHRGLFSDALLSLRTDCTAWNDEMRGL